MVMKKKVVTREDHEYHCDLCNRKSAYKKCFACDKDLCERCRVRYRPTQALNAEVFYCPACDIATAADKNDSMRTAIAAAEAVESEYSAAHDHYLARRAPHLKAIDRLLDEANKRRRNRES